MVYTQHYYIQFGRQQIIIVNYLESYVTAVECKADSCHYLQCEHLQDLGLITDHIIPCWVTELASY